MSPDQQHELCTLFQQFCQEYQHPYVPPYPEFHRLFTLSAQARQQRAQLTEATVQCLEELSFDWLITNQESRWMYNYHQLKDYYDQWGNSDVAQHFPINQRLGSWAYRQRGRREQLTTRQVTMLDQLDFTWIDGSETYLSPLYQDRWDRMFAQLEAYQREHGHVMVPSSYEDQTLARWVIHQRKTADRLSDEQRLRLEELGFVFDMQLHKDLSWEYMYEQLRYFWKEEGHSSVPRAHPNQRLSNWVRTQRYHQSQLTAQKVEKLRLIDFRFAEDKASDRDVRWMRNFRRVESFYKEHGHLRHPDAKLYRWIYKQKSREPSEDYRRVLLKELGISYGK